MKATHNSATGEPSHGLLAHLVAPFSRCQSKNLLEQIFDGVQVFDLRCRYSRRRQEYYLCHGLWRTDATLEHALLLLDEVARCNAEDLHVLLTYEGMLDDEERAIFLDYCTLLTEQYPHVHFIYFAVKLPRWEVLYQFADNPVRLHKDFTDLSRFPQCLLPIPRLWAWLHRPPLPHIYNPERDALLRDFV